MRLLAKDDAGAAQALERAAALAPEHPLTLRARARLLLKAGKGAEAVALAERAAAAMPSDLESALVFAAALGAAGRDAEAKALIERILAARPDYAEAWANGALLLLRAKDLPGALAAGQRAVALKPHLEQIWALVAGILGQMRRWDEAAAALQKSLELSPDDPKRLADLGEYLRRAGRLDEALAALQRAVALAPDSYPAWVNLGTALHEAERLDEAKAAYERALALEPNSAEVANNLGAMAKDREDWEEALRYFEQALATKPEHVEVLTNKAAALLALERDTDAESLARKAIKLDPLYKQAYVALVSTLNQQERFSEAETVARRCLELDPSYAEGRIALASALAGLGRYAEAETMLRAVAGLADGSSEPTATLDALSLYKVLNQLGTMYAELGRKDEAKAMFFQAIERKPDDPIAYYGLADVYRFQRHDGYLERLETLYERSKHHPIPHHEYLLYALAAAYEHIGERERSFDLVLEASRRRRQAIRYDADAKDRFFQTLVQAFSREIYESLQGRGYPTTLPVFILGMPRSGTTLMEQILAAHPAVHGAGELKLLSQALAGGLRLGSLVLGSRLPGALDPSQVPPAEEALAAIGQRYATALRSLHPTARHITDKMPGNFTWVPLIALAMPGAKIIHMRRHPLDTCLSCLRTRFAHGQEWSYDLTELGRYYSGYWRLMAHWRQVCPDAFLDVDYERLVAEPEAETRRVLDYLGLPWDPACLRFYELARPVRTASRSQVRQPLYTTSQGKWRGLLPRLGPLIAALDPELRAAYAIPEPEEAA